MIEDVETRRVIATEVRPVEPDDLRSLGTGWRFNCQSAVGDVEVFKLIDPVAPDSIHGRIALRRHDNYVEVTLLEAHSQSIGRTKKFLGISGSLFAFAAQLSFAIGGEGFIAIEAKTNLIEHFRSLYGFERVGQSQRMILDNEAAANLINQFGGRMADL
jgi:hypothetical protein